MVCAVDFIVFEPCTGEDRITGRRDSVSIFVRNAFLTGVAGLVAVLIVLATPPSLEQLTTDLKSPDPKVRRKAAEEMGKLRDREALSPLLSAAQDPDAKVREEVVKSLGALRDQKAITMLLTTLKDLSASVREESLFALVNLYAEKDEGFSFTRLAQKTYKTINTINPYADNVGHDPTIVEPWVKVSPVVTDAIAERLLDSNLGLRLNAAKALGVLKAENAIPKMLEAMKTGDSKLRIALLRSLYKIGNPSVDTGILPYLNDADKDVRDETMLTLGLFRSRKALPEVQKIYEKNPDTKLRLKALQAISLIGDPSSKELFQRNLRDPDARYRQYAAEGLARIADASLTEEISRALINEKKEPTQLALSFALYRMGRREYLDKLVTALGSRQYHDQVEAYFLEMGKPLSYDLVNFLNNEDPHIRARLCSVLGQIGDRSILDKINPLLKDSNSEVVSEATQAIKRLGAS